MSKKIIINFKLFNVFFLFNELDKTKITGFTLHFFLHTNFTFQCTFLSKNLCVFMVRHYVYRISSQKCTKDIILVSTHAHNIRCKTTSLQSLLTLYILRHNVTRHHLDGKTSRLNEHVCVKQTGYIGRDTFFQK